MIGGSIISDAIIDCIVYIAERINLEVDSMLRKDQNKNLTHVKTAKRCHKKHNRRQKISRARTFRELLKSALRRHGVVAVSARSASSSTLWMR